MNKVVEATPLGVFSRSWTHFLGVAPHIGVRLMNYLFPGREFGQHFQTLRSPEAIHCHVRLLLWGPRPFVRAACAPERGLHRITAGFFIHVNLREVTAEPNKSCLATAASVGV